MTFIILNGSYIYNHRCSGFNSGRPALMVLPAFDVASDAKPFHFIQNAGDPDTPALVQGLAVAGQHGHVCSVKQGRHVGSPGPAVRSGPQPASQPQGDLQDGGEVTWSDAPASKKGE